ncbi:MAG TPA: hypothetical protein VH858_01455 [Hyphomicrobiales bacterium]
MIFDRFIHPNKWKMAACIQPDCLFFFRINSSDRWLPAIKLERDPHHAFLDHDSFLECSLPFELTEYEVEQSLKRRGVLGTLHQSLAPAIYELVKNNPVISADDKAAIGLALVGARRA